MPKSKAKRSKGQQISMKRAQAVHVQMVKLGKAEWDRIHHKKSK
jgi:hypothetical protein